jgi:hypothetical protein
MARWAHADLLDGGCGYIKANCDKIIAAAAYTSGDTYATVTGGTNLLAEITMTKGSGTDFVLSGAAGADRVVTTLAKNDTSANNTGTVTHFVFLDAANSKVLLATPESSGQSITSGNQVNFPALTYTSKQPTA